MTDSAAACWALPWARRHEGGSIERLLWALIGRTRKILRRWTDDTQRSLDLARSLLACDGLDLDHLAFAFAASYRCSRGYGPGATKLLKRIGRGMPWRDANRSVFESRPFGNGGAMRTPVIGLYFAGQEPSAVAAFARDSASVTHAHPLGMEGAAACCLEPYLLRLERARNWLQAEQRATPREVRAQLGNRIVADESCVTALYLAVRFLDSGFLELLACAADCGGDVDTIGAMAGAIWGAGAAGQGAGRLGAARGYRGLGGFPAAGWARPYYLMMFPDETLVSAEREALDDLHQRIARGDGSDEYLRHAPLPTVESVLIDAGLRLLPVLEDEVAERGLAGRMRAIIVRLEYVGEEAKVLQVVARFQEALAAYHRKNRATGLWVMGLLLLLGCGIAALAVWWWNS